MKKFISVMFIAIFILSISHSNLFASTYFSDVAKDSWYRGDLDYIMQDSRKIVVGFPDGTFKPDDTFTLAQLVTCVVVSSYYTDIKKEKSSGKWYEPFVNKAKELNYIQDGEFRNYEMSVTRGNMAKIMVRAVENVWGKYSFRDAEKIKPLIKDYDSIPDNLKDFVVKAYDMGLISGFPDGTFGANKLLNRAQAVVVLRKLIDPAKRASIKLDQILPKSESLVLNDKVYRVNPDIPQELYQYEYRKSPLDNLSLSNKWMVERYGLEKVTEFMNIGKKYMETFYNVDYSSYNKSKYIESLKWFFMPQTKWMADDGVERPIDEHIKYWADMVEKNQISIKTEFSTNPSLVYSNGSSVVRGELNSFIESCNDLNWLKKYSRLGNVELKKKYSCIFEVELANMELKDGWDHASRVVNNEVILSKMSEVK